MLMNTIGKFCLKAEQRIFQKLTSPNSIKNISSGLRAKPAPSFPARTNFHRKSPVKRNGDLYPSSLVQYFYNASTDTPSSRLLRHGINNFVVFTPRNGTNSKIEIYFPRQYATSGQKDDDQSEPPKMRVPRLILLQNPFTWLLTKFDFSVLRNVWDPTFEEKEFKIGTKQAVSRVTKLLSEGRYADLSGLLTRPARLTLLRDLERTWTDKQRKLIALSNEDIQITSPRKVYFIRVAEKKYCAVDMAFLALKWASARRADGLVFAEIFARFHREYTAYSIPEWTIAYFKVTRFDILRRKTASGKR